MKKSGIKVLLAIATVLILFLGTTSVIYAEKPNREFTVNVKTVLEDGGYHLLADVHNDGYRIYGWYSMWYKWDDTNERWILEETKIHPFVGTFGGIGGLLTGSCHVTLEGPSNQPCGDLWKVSVSFIRKNSKPWQKPFVSDQVKLPCSP
ncbi:hypothetical protein ACFLUH_01455 [Chloroflexota bacterium]